MGQRTEAEIEKELQSVVNSLDKVGKAMGDDPSIGDHLYVFNNSKTQGDLTYNDVLLMQTSKKAALLWVLKRY